MGKWYAMAIDEASEEEAFAGEFEAGLQISLGIGR
jgi:hypothetical protein